MKILTEAEVRARLDMAIAEAGSASALARDNGFDPSYIYMVRNGSYAGNGVPPRLLSAIGVRKRLVYELVGNE